MSDTKAGLVARGYGFKLGTSGNPGGRTKVEKKIRVAWNRIAKDNGKESAIDEFVQMLHGIATDPKVAARDRIVAIRTLKEAGYGKAKETVVFEDADTIRPSADWSAKPIEEKRRLLQLAGELGALETDVGPTEH